VPIQTSFSLIHKFFTFHNMADPILAELRAMNDSDPSKAAIRFTDELGRLDDDPVAQFEFAKQAAILGLRDAVHFVVKGYQDGKGTEPDRVRAFEWMRKAAVKDNDDSFFFDLACCFRDGDGTARDTAEFWFWMTKAAETGKSNDTQAMFELAKAHMNPDMGKHSPERANELTSRMAEKNEPVALIQLARDYDDGERVARDRTKFLKYATDAVSAARSQWDSRLTGGDDWIYESLPEALSVLADALKRNDKPDEASARNAEAAQVAWDAFESARAAGVSVGLPLPEIMLRLIPQLKSNGGAPLTENREKYFRWLTNIKSAVGHIYLSKDVKEIPANLVEAIFDLSIAYRDGIGTAPKKKSYAQFLREAADAGHGQAAYLCAIGHLRKGELLEFNQFISSAANANDMNAMIAQQLVSGGLRTWRKFQPAHKALQSLRETVVQIRNQEHKVNEKAASAGIAHYTKGDALANMLSGSPLDGKNGVWLSSTVYVNDPTEGKRLKDFDCGEIENPLTALFDGMRDAGSISWLDKEFHVFIACFSLELDSLNLWRFYGSDGKGYSIVSPLSAFDAGTTEGIIRGPWAKRGKTPSKLALYKVLYEDQEVKDALVKLAEALKPVLKIARGLGGELDKRVRSVAIAVISDLLYLYKDTQYAQEKEVRAAEARTLGDPEVKAFKPGDKQYSKLYLETGALLFREPGSAIIIGPKVEDREAVMIYLQHRLAHQNWSGTCKVSKSPPNYR
jgi:TPR repeat protein